MEHCTGLMVLSAAWVLVVASPFAMADAKLPAVIGDNMVLQREMAVPIWGKADPGEKVTVSLGSQRVRAKADEQGRWMVKLAPLEAGGPLEMHVTAKNRITRSNIFVGDVWVCSGQSNMAWRVQQAANPEAEIAAADHPSVRRQEGCSRGASGRHRRRVVRLQLADGSGLLGGRLLLRAGAAQSTGRAHRTD